MSETVKLIIEISEERYNSIMRKAKYTRVTGIDAVLAKGVPLDSVKAEIRRMEYHMIDCDVLVDQDMVMWILDNIGKAENEGV